MLVLAWAAAAAVLVVLARFEERLEWAALTFFGLALVHTLVMEAQPSDLFVAQRQPGSGIPAVLLVIAAGCRSHAGAPGCAPPSSGCAARWACTPPRSRSCSWPRTSAAQTSTTSFQRGHTAVSSLWGVVGLGLLYAGLKRGRRELQIGGFVLFGISLAKLFVYDLAFLSSIARAFSFLAVGGLILVAGFFYQRLAGGHTAART